MKESQQWRTRYLFCSVCVCRGVCFLSVRIYCHCNYNETLNLCSQYFIYKSFTSQENSFTISDYLDINQCLYFFLFFFPRSSSRPPAPPRRHRTVTTRVYGPLHPGCVHHQEVGLLWHHHARWEEHTHTKFGSFAAIYHISYQRLANWIRNPSGPYLVHRP